MSNLSGSSGLSPVTVKLEMTENVENAGDGGRADMEAGCESCRTYDDYMIIYTVMWGRGVGHVRVQGQ